jgi:hypothetical protein
MSSLADDDRGGVILWPMTFTTANMVAMVIMFSLNLSQSSIHGLYSTSYSACRPTTVFGFYGTANMTEKMPLTGTYVCTLYISTLKQNILAKTPG